MNVESLEIVPPDYALAYSTLARRVAAAEAFLAGGLQDRAYEQLCRAVEVIEQVENVRAVLTKSAPFDLLDGCGGAVYSATCTVHPVPAAASPVP